MLNTQITRIKYAIILHALDSKTLNAPLQTKYPYKHE